MIPISDDNPARSTSYVTLILIGICIAVYLWELSLGNRSDSTLAVLGFTPDSLVNPQDAPSPWLGIPPWTTILTSLFPQRATAFKARSDEQVTAGIYAGAQWRFDAVGADAGRRIAALVLDRVKADRVGKNA